MSSEPIALEKMLVTYQWPFLKEIDEIFKDHLSHLKANVTCTFEAPQDALRFTVHWHWLLQVKRSLVIKSVVGTAEENQQFFPPQQQEYIHGGSVYYGCYLQLPFQHETSAELFPMYAAAVESQFNNHKAEIVKRITNKSVYGTDEEPKWDQSSQSADSLDQAKVQSGTSLSVTTGSSKSPSLNL